MVKIFASPEKPGARRENTQFLRQSAPVFFGTLPKKSAEKDGKSKKHPKNQVYNLYFKTFVKFLQFFDHFTVEIFSGLDYNENRKSKEGPMC